MMLGSKDAIRIVPYFVLPQFYPIFAYREAYAPLLCSYRGGSLSHKTTFVQAHRGFRLLPLASCKCWDEDSWSWKPTGIKCHRLRALFGGSGKMGTLRSRPFEGDTGRAVRERALNVKRGRWFICKAGGTADKVYPSRNSSVLFRDFFIPFF